jgi:23S rRNA (uracil1939-C5)-methyltransferase
MKQTRKHTVKLDAIVGGGQALGTLDDGRKALVWGGLPGETVTIRETKHKSKYIEGVVESIEQASSERIEPADPESYLSTSPWQIMNFAAEQRHKVDLVRQAFTLHDLTLGEFDIFSDENMYHYRNKVEFSWYSDALDDGSETLDLAFFRRGSKGKIIIDECALLPDSMMALAYQIRDALHAQQITARSLKTLLIRCDASGNCVWQLYVKDEDFAAINDEIASKLNAQGGEVIYSDPRSPASRITKRLAQSGDITLSDTILGVDFKYPAESFFQINLPIYEQSLRDIQQFVDHAKPLVDLYSGVGTIGLTVGSGRTTLIEINEPAVEEMRRNIARLNSNAQAVLAASEHALDHISADATIIVDPPRAGLHEKVVEKLLEAEPQRIIYLSCNPVTQARDTQLLSEKYAISYNRAYNFFPRTPHIEHLVVLDKK